MSEAGCSFVLSVLGGVKITLLPGAPVTEQAAFGFSSRLATTGFDSSDFLIGCGSGGWAGPQSPAPPRRARLAVVSACCSFVAR